MTHSQPRLSTFVLCAGLVAGGAAAQPAGQGAPAAASKAAAPAADKSFAQKAAVGGMAEVELGKLAEQKAASDAVKQFGSRMVADHSKANEELKQIAGEKGLTLPAELDAKNKSELAKMQKLSGAQFDRAYMDDMLADHKNDVADFRKEASSGHDSDLKSYAAKTLPTLEEHLQMAQTTDAAVRSGGKAGAPAMAGSAGKP